MLKNQEIEKPILLKDLGVKKPKETSTYKVRYGLFKCSCGNEFTAIISSVKTGHTNSCGCYGRAKRLQACTKHGMCNHRLYSIWEGMRQRCNNKNHSNYNYYGGRGIKVCEEWNDFSNFVRDMLPTFKEGLTIDRIDNNKGYSKENCRWVTKVVQSRNTRILRNTNTSGYRGVSFLKNIKKWSSGITVKYKKINIGYFNTSKEAAIAYNNYVIKNKLEHSLNIF